MKRGTPGHYKMHALAERLGIALFGAVGIMEMLWHHVGVYAPSGDIGRVPDAEISRAVYWNKRVPVLIDGLVGARWLDPDDTYRLIVHDWPDHAEDAVRKKLIRLDKDFLPVYGKSVYDCRKPSRRHPEESQDTVATPSVIRARASGVWRPASGSGEGKGVQGGHEISEEDIPQVRRWLYEYMGEEWPEPDPQLCERVLLAAKGDLEGLRAFLTKLNRQGKKPSGSWTWFIPVVERHFAGAVRVG